MKGEDRIKDLRAEIDRIDDRILDLLNRRASLAIDIGVLKAENKREFYSPERERQIYQRLIKNNKGPFPNTALRSVFREIISASLSLEQPLKVAYLGPKATFTHIACMKHFGLSARFIPRKDIADVFNDVERGRVECGVVPIENSTEGVVTHTLDMFLDSNLKITAEILLEISLSLLSRTGRMEDIKRIYSHPHAIAQCKEWLNKNLPDIPIFDTSSTASAAQMVVDDPEAGAIASEFAANLYDLQIVERKIEDNANNFTRFLIIGLKEQKRTGDDKTSLMFSIKDEPGALYRMLKPFAERGINLTKIESRPEKRRAWEYVFFLDLDGHTSDAKVMDAIKELEEMCVFLRVLGSYPKGKTV